MLIGILRPVTGDACASLSGQSLSQALKAVRATQAGDPALLIVPNGTTLPNVFSLTLADGTIIRYHRS